MRNAIGCDEGGSWVIGKNVPENRNSGVITNRNRAAKLTSLRWVAANAMMGAANARPVRTAAGSIAIPRTEVHRAEGDRHEHEHAAHDEQPDDDEQQVPMTTSNGRRGVVTIATNVRSQVRPAMMG